MGSFVTIFCIVFMVMFISPACLYGYFEAAMAGPRRHYQQKELTKVFWVIGYIINNLYATYSIHCVYTTLLTSRAHFLHMFAIYSKCYMAEICS